MAWKIPDRNLTPCFRDTGLVLRQFRIRYKSTCDMVNDWIL